MADGAEDVGLAAARQAEGEQVFGAFDESFVAECRDLSPDLSRQYPFEYFITEYPYSAPEIQVDSNDSPDVNFWQFGPPWGASPCGGEDEEKSRPSGDNYPDTGGW
jgi:hypothetical protein